MRGRTNTTISGGLDSRRRREWRVTRWQSWRWQDKRKEEERTRESGEKQQKETRHSRSFSKLWTVVGSNEVGRHRPRKRTWTNQTKGDQRRKNLREKGPMNAVQHSPCAKSAARGGAQRSLRHHRRLQRSEVDGLRALLRDKFYKSICLLGCLSLSQSISVSRAQALIFSFWKFQICPLWHAMNPSSFVLWFIYSSFTIEVVPPNAFVRMSWCKHCLKPVLVSLYFEQLPVTSTRVEFSSFQ